MILYKKLRHEILNEEEYEKVYRDVLNFFRKQLIKMSKITKIAMAQALKKLLIVKDLDKITINDISNECGINRQTFYYHFRDIYDLLEWIFANEVVEKIENETNIDNWQEQFMYVLNYMLENKFFIMKVYNSLSKHICENYSKYIKINCN